MTRIAVLLVLTCAAGAFAQSEIASPQDEEIHNELRALGRGFMDAINTRDLEQQLNYLHPNVVVTWHNAEVSRGRGGVRSYLNRILAGPNAAVANFTADLEVDELSILYGGDTAIAFGSAVEHFEMTNGMSFVLPARWSATLVREGNQWLVANLHASDNLFDNPMLNAAGRMTYWAGGAMLVVGLIAGFLVGRIRKRSV